jgi:tetratricopeptide (TPR) repeat protein
MIRLVLALAAALPTAAAQTAPTPDDLVRAGLAAEAAQDVQRALDLFLAAEKAGRADALLFQKIARQYSDRTVTLPTRDAQRASAEKALAYSERAFALDPRSAVNALSVAISQGKLAIYSDTRDKVRLSRLVRDYAERALALDPAYAWAHHVLGRWHHEVVDLGATARFFVRVFYGGLPPASAAEGVRLLERAVALEPGELQHRLELGFAYLSADDPTAAAAAFRRGLEMPSRAVHDEPAKARARAALAKLES